MRPVRPKSISQKQIQEFQKEIWQYYAKNRRDFAWRRAAHYCDPYKILVSEVMLQQTQVGRVVGKYEEFLQKFPTLLALEKASITDVVAAWSGLGYNRRALALKKIAAIAGEKWQYKLPKLSVEELDALPHIGYATACSISAFAWDVPVSFIETNIRRVFIHYFFKGQEQVSDIDVLALVRRSLPNSASPREWYYALMDYGSMLKSATENPNRRSKGYKRQSVFTGSNRQVRGAILAVLTDPKNEKGCSKKVLLNFVRNFVAKTDRSNIKNVVPKINQKDMDKNVATLTREGFLHISGSTISLAN